MSKTGPANNLRSRPNNKFDNDTIASKSDRLAREIRNVSKQKRFDANRNTYLQELADERAAIEREQLREQERIRNLERPPRGFEYIDNGRENVIENEVRDPIESWKNSLAYKQADVVEDNTLNLNNFLTETLSGQKNKENRALAPSWYGDLAKKANEKSEELEKWRSLNDTSTNEQNAEWKKLAAEKYAKWNGTKYEFTDENIKNRMKNNVERPNDFKKIGVARSLLNTSLQPGEAERMIPETVRLLVEENNNFSEVGFGPIAKNGIPLYAGRWLDPVTNRVRILPQASKKFVNPSSWNQVRGYLVANVLNKWNKFVEAEQQFLNMNNYTQTEFKQKAIESFTNSYKNNTEAKDVVSWYKKEIELAAVDVSLCSKSTRLLQKHNLLDGIPKIVMDGSVPDTVRQQVRTKLIDNWNNVAVPKIEEEEKIKEYIKTQDAVKVWMEKGYTSLNNLVNKAFKLSIPDSVTTAELLEMKEKKEELTKEVSNNFLRPESRSGLQTVISNFASNPSGASNTTLTNFIKANGRKGEVSNNKYDYNFLRGLEKLPLLGQ